MTRIQAVAQRARVSHGSARQEPLTQRDQSSGDDSFRDKQPAERRMRAAQSKTQTKRKQDIAEDVEQIVELPAAFAFHELRPRDLAIAAVANAEDLIQEQAPDD